MKDLRVRPEEEGEEAKENQIGDMKSAEKRVKKMERVAEKSLPSSAAKSIWDCGSPLYDSYELVSVTHVIERHWMIFPFHVASSSKNSSSNHETFRRSMSSRNTVMNRTMTMSNNKISTGEARNKDKAETTTSGFARFFCCSSRN